MPTTIALAPLTHPDTGKLIAAGEEVTLGDEDYADMRADGKVAASAQEQKAHATPEAEGNYGERVGREDTTSTKPSCEQEVMPGILRFLANATDPNNPKVTYGAGHETDFQDENEPWVIELRREGKAEILEYTPPATRAAPAAEKKTE